MEFVDGDSVLDPTSSLGEDVHTVLPDEDSIVVIFNRPVRTTYEDPEDITHRTSGPNLPLVAPFRQSPAGTLFLRFAGPDSWAPRLSPTNGASSLTGFWVSNCAMIPASNFAEGN